MRIRQGEEPRNPEVKMLEIWWPEGDESQLPGNNFQASSTDHNPQLLFNDVSSYAMTVLPLIVNAPAD
ncbi:unnamed protein product [Gongylonema pulchrum]|uniref:UnbV_ASPIC domain-containing protein n=1 Tax=Gongylonema pulchrum TaxID=637853 RepID=A0A183CUR4_9BILA|nr:unnamed protein product [Gongylonema pulchrum]